MLDRVVLRFLVPQRRAGRNANRARHLRITTARQTQKGRGKMPRRGLQEPAVRTEPAQTLNGPGLHPLSPAVAFPCLQHAARLLHGLERGPLPKNAGWLQAILRWSCSRVRDPGQAGILSRLSITRRAVGRVFVDSEVAFK